MGTVIILILQMGKLKPQRFRALLCHITQLQGCLSFSLGLCTWCPLEVYRAQTVQSPCAVLNCSLPSDFMCDHMDYSPPGSSARGNSPGKNTEVGCHALLQGIFPTQGSSPGPPHCRQILYCLNHQRSPYSQPAETLSNLPKVATLITKEM